MILLTNNTNAFLCDLFDCPPQFLVIDANLNNLDDVNINSPTNNQVIAYNSTTLQWENADQNAGGGGVDGNITDTTLDTNILADKNWMLGRKTFTFSENTEGEENATIVIKPTVEIGEPEFFLTGINDTTVVFSIDGFGSTFLEELILNAGSEQILFDPDGTPQILSSNSSGVSDSTMTFPLDTTVLAGTDISQNFLLDQNFLSINGFDVNVENLFIQGIDFNTVYDARYITPQILRTYTGISPITVDSDSNQVGLNVGATDDWNGLFDGQEGAYYLDWTNSTNKLFSLLSLDDNSSFDERYNLTTDTNDVGRIEHDSTVGGTIASHDTNATGAELDTLTDNSMADPLHRHSELSASDGLPDKAMSVTVDGDVVLNNGADLALLSDNSVLSFGATSDIIMRYNGTNLQIIPDFVGNGGVWIDKGAFDAVDFGQTNDDDYALIATMKETSDDGVYGLWAAGQYGGASTYTKGVFGINSFGYITSNEDVTGRIEGGFYEARMLGTGTVDKAGGIRVRGQATAAGDVVVHKGFEVLDFSNTGGGALGENTGLWINDLTAATTNYGVVIDSDTIGLTLGADQDATLLWNSVATTLDSDFYYVGAGTGLPYGSFYGNNIGWSSTSFGGGGTFVIVSDSDITGSNVNMTAFQNDQEIRLVHEGVYHVTWSISGECAGANKHIEVAIGLNGTANVAGRNHFETGNANQEYTIAGTAILDLAAGNTLSIMITNVDDDTQIEVHHVNLTTVHLGGT